MSQDASTTPLLTPLASWHREHGARMIEFGGWSMPVLYSSIVEEHQAVRNRMGLFDISHMGRLRFQGAGAQSWLDYLTTNHVARLKPGRVQYSLCVAEDGGILDDLLVSQLAVDDYLVVCNAANRETVLAQFHAERPPEAESVRFEDQTEATGMIALQGPRASKHLETLLGPEPTALHYYRTGTFNVPSLERTSTLVSRTGYTGEDGFELIVPREQALAIWEQLRVEDGHDEPVMACGLGARDTLRFEAAMPLYGHELDRQTNPYAVGLDWVVKLDKGPFIGREALLGHRERPGLRRIGLRLEGRRIARQGAIVLLNDTRVGVVTSGTLAPSLGLNLAMARIDGEVNPEHSGDGWQVEIRGHRSTAEVVPLPFYQRLDRIAARS